MTRYYKLNDIPQLISNRPTFQSSNTISRNVSSNRLKFTLHVSIGHSIKRHAFLFLSFSPLTKKPFIETTAFSLRVEPATKYFELFLYFSREGGEINVKYGEDTFDQFLSVNVKFSKSDFNDTAHASCNIASNPLTGNK